MVERNRGMPGGIPRPSVVAEDLPTYVRRRSKQRRIHVTRIQVLLQLIEMHPADDSNVTLLPTRNLYNNR